MRPQVWDALTSRRNFPQSHLPPGPRTPPPSSFFCPQKRVPEPSRPGGSPQLLPCLTPACCAPWWGAGHLGSACREKAPPLGVCSQLWAPTQTAGKPSLHEPPWGLLVSCCMGDRSLGGRRARPLTPRPPHTVCPHCVSAGPHAALSVLSLSVPSERHSRGPGGLLPLPTRTRNSQEQPWGGSHLEGA